MENLKAEIEPDHTASFETTKGQIINGGQWYVQCGAHKTYTL